MEISHHNFFSVCYPKHTEDSELQEAFLEEAFLSYNGEITPSYNYENKSRTLLDVSLLPFTDIRYILKSYTKDSERTRHLNDTIDARFVDILIKINPIYKIGLFLDYHFSKYNGEVEDFFKHLKFIIIPLSKIQLEKLSKLTDLNSENIPLPEHVEELVLDWIKAKGNKKESTFISFDEKDQEDYLKSKIQYRYKDAEFFLDLLISEGYIKIEKLKVQEYFIQWFYKNKEIDLQIENGDFAIEDGDIKIIPDFEKEDIVKFLTWFNSERENFKIFLKSNGFDMENEEKVFSTNISNAQNVIINNDSHVENQNNVKNDNLNWTKIGVYIAIIAVVVTIVIAFYENWNN